MDIHIEAIKVLKAGTVITATLLALVVARARTLFSRCEDITLYT